MADDTLDQPTRASQAPTDVTRLNAWIDAQLGRTLTLVALRRSGANGEDSGDPLENWRLELPLFPCVQLIVEVTRDEPITEALARIAQRDPDTLLVCDDASNDAEAASHWRAAVLDAAEGANLFERMEITLVGVGMTRAIARSRGFEDGFASDQPLAEALAVLAREAVTRASYRRYGSSPPCYL
ncbi:MAG TPA: hypothetical protein VE338_03280 [Ktedonobacterales bacterium]|jgi:hypothetical protein|nr:hypothetical protein [Ktedonobacterales bacterium]